MGRCNRLVLSLFVIGFWTAPAAAEQLWENTSYGMSREALKRAQPLAVDGDEPSCAMKIPNKKIAGYDMVVGFGIPPKTNVLDHVSLMQSGNAAAYSDLSKALTVKFGQPVSTNCHKLTGRCSSAWVKGSISVELAGYPNGDTYVTYQGIETAGL